MKKNRFEQSTMMDHMDPEAPRGGAAVYALVALGLLMAALVISWVYKWSR